MENRLTSYCMQVHSFIQAHANERHPISDEVIDTWENFDPWTGEEQMLVSPEGRRYLCDADQRVVDVTDVPLQYEVEPVKPPKIEREIVAQRVFDSWPRATAVRYSVDSMRKIDEQLVELHVTFDTGFVLHAGPWRMSTAQRELASLFEHGWDDCDPELLK